MTSEEEDDCLVDNLIAENAAFQELIVESANGPRKPFRLGNIEVEPTTLTESDSDHDF